MTTHLGILTLSAKFCSVSCLAVEHELTSRQLLLYESMLSMLLLHNSARGELLQVQLLLTTRSVQNLGLL